MQGKTSQSNTGDSPKQEAECEQPVCEGGQPFREDGGFVREGGQPSQEGRQASGLRERKKEQTRQSLEKAILRLVLEKGYEEVTIDEVCDVAGVSRKTFFNYFSSKRAAVLGRSYIPTAEQMLDALEEYADSNYLDVVTRCIEDGLAAAEASPEMMALRKQAMLKSPEIFFRTNKSSLTLQPSINEALSVYLSKHPDKRKMPDASLEEECLAGTSVIVCLMRTHSMFSSFGRDDMGVKATRLLVKSYLA